MEGGIVKKVWSFALRLSFRCSGIASLVIILYETVILNQFEDQVQE